MLSQADATGVLDAVQAQAAELLKPLEAKLQAQVGLFLTDKAFLLDAKNRAPTIQLQQQAQDLYQEQVQLEGELGAVLPPIQAGTYDYGTVTAAASLYGRMQMHRDRVNALRKSLGV